MADTVILSNQLREKFQHIQSYLREQALQALKHTWSNSCLTESAKEDTSVRVKEGEIVKGNSRRWVRINEAFFYFLLLFIRLDCVSLVKGGNLIRLKSHLCGQIGREGDKLQIFFFWLRKKNIFF